MCEGVRCGGRGGGGYWNEVHHIFIDKGFIASQLVQLLFSRVSCRIFSFGGQYLSENLDSESH